MSIASEISRLQGAKADIKTAIEGKGVTVPSATKIDGYADLVDAIPQGSTPTGTKQISVTQNGTQTENVSGYASAQLNVAVPNSYSAGDEGKVVSSGALVNQTSQNIDTNGTYDTTLKNEVVVNVSGGTSLTADQLATRDFTGYGNITITGTTIRAYAFENSPITGVAADSATTIHQYAFNNCRSLVNASFASWGGWANAPYTFTSCSNLKSINLPKLSVVSQQMLRYCTSLEYIVLPKVASFNSWGISGCTSLKAADFGNSGQSGVSLQSAALSSNPALNIFVLRYSAVATLSGTDFLSGTPFASGGSGGTLYVPQSLLSQYTQATNWSTILGYTNNQILPIEGSIYETQYADGTPIT